ncbi:MAG: PQQ-binding-like beta-propeller repeat protein, partial [Planctomycetales bacterium]
MIAAVTAERIASRASLRPGIRLLPAWSFPLLVGGVLLPGAFSAAAHAQEVPPAGLPAAQDGANTPARDPYREQYEGYRPAFLETMRTGGGFQGWSKSEEEMRLSTETSFFTLNVLHEDSRANALVAAGLKKEAEGQHREALAIYQQVIEKFPEALYRVSEHGVFVPVSQYCQRRILEFPKNDLDFYRQLYDSRAREAFEQARRQYSLLGLSDVVNSMLATSYGGPALLELGNAALDSGHYLSALEYFSTVRDSFPDEELRTPDLELKIELCRKMLGQETSKVAGRESKETAEPATNADGRLSTEQRGRFEQVIGTARFEAPPFHSQVTSDPHSAADDYTLMPASDDPLAVKEPVWEIELPGSRSDFFVYSQPVVARDSVIYRHKNIVYCRSVLNGSLRWKNDMGGRATWQDWGERQYPQEDLLVQDGLVFTAISKAGPSLVALDEVTGQLRWAYGPMVAANVEESRMRFETAPAGGPRTVYAGYVLDNIEGETHTDSEYGLIAFESTTGRLQWRAPLCRLAPGKFAGGFAERRRNRIRSFTSPPLYHEGVVYYNTNAGAIAALDALSGRIKWLARYPYYPDVHDATRQFGRGGGPASYTRVFFEPHSPMFWYNQRPLLVGERLIVPAVDSNMLFSLDRRTGKVEWARTKTGTASAYVLGMTRNGELAVAYTGRNGRIRWHGINSPGPVHLLDPKTGETLWQSPDLVMKDDQPVMKHYTYMSQAMHFDMNESWFEMAARPFMTRDGRVCVTSFRYVGYPIYGWISSLGCLDLEKRKVVAQRRYYSGEILSRAHTDITVHGPEELEAYESLPIKDDAAKQRIALLKDVVADIVPRNEHGPFMPFSRVSFERYAVPFEVRMSARSVQMVYDREAVSATVA